MRTIYKFAIFITTLAAIPLSSTIAPARAASFNISGQFDSRVFPGSTLQNGTIDGVFSYDDATGEPRQDFSIDLVRASGGITYTFSPLSGSLQFLRPNPGEIELFLQGSTPTTPTLPTLDLVFASQTFLSETSSFERGLLTDPANQSRTLVSTSLRAVPEPSTNCLSVAGVAGALSVAVKRNNRKARKVS
jgi:hypothetical protein